MVLTDLVNMSLAVMVMSKIEEITGSLVVFC